MQKDGKYNGKGELDEDNRNSVGAVRLSARSEDGSNKISRGYIGEKEIIGVEAGRRNYSWRRGGRSGHRGEVLIQNVGRDVRHWWGGVLTKGKTAEGGPEGAGVRSRGKEYLVILGTGFLDFRLGKVSEGFEG